MIIREFFMKTIIIPYLYGSIMPTPRLTHAKTILSITDELLATRLLTLGIFPGKKINLIRRSPFGGSCYVQVDQTLYALRAEEWKAIITDEEI